MKKLYLIPLLFITSFTLSQTLENAGFENWEVEGLINEPVDWSSIQTGLPSTTAALAPEVMTQSTDARTGTYSVKLENKTSFTIVVNGILTNGRVDLDPTNGFIYTDPADPKYNTPFTTRPDSLIGYFKYTPSGGDKLTVEAVLHTGSAKLPDTDSTNFIGFGLYTSANSTFSSWTRFSLAIDYRSANNPEYILVIFNAGNLSNAVSGSIAYFDDISLVFNGPVGITQPLFGNTINMYGGYNQIYIDLRQAGSNSDYDLKVHDILGKLVHKASVTSGSDHRITGLHPGMYICNLVGNQGMILTKKVIVQ